MRKSTLICFVLFASLAVLSCRENGDEYTPPETCTVTLYANGGTMTNGDTSSTIRKTYTVAYGEELLLDSAEDLGLTYSGQHFLGWAEQQSSTSITYNNQVLLQIYSDLILYAVWKAAETETYYISASGDDSTGDGSAANPFATLDKAVTKITSKYNDYIFSISGETTSGGISFTDSVYSSLEANSVTITGATDSSTDGISLSGSSSIITISTTVPVTIQKLTLRNGKGTSLTGKKLGGAIYISSPTARTATVTIDSVCFTDNTASYGGALYNGHGIVSLTDCSFSSNESENIGGAIYNDGTLSLTACTISENSSSDSAGGMYNRASLTVSGSSITGNTAVNGGGIYNSGTILLQETCAVTKNSAEKGGGIFNASSGGFTFSTGKITENSASFFGGAVYNDGTLETSGLSIQSNEVSSESGTAPGVYNNGELTLTNTNINNHESLTKGSALYNTSDGNAIFSGTASSNSAVDGAAFYNEGTLTIQSGILKNNTASGYGGAIYSIGTLSIVRCDISYNEAVNGGAIALVGTDSNCMFAYGTVELNTAENGGGFYIEAGNLALSDDSDSGVAQILDNTATGYGGGVYLKSGSLTVTAGIISAFGKRVQENAYGGAAYYYSGNKAGENRNAGTAAENESYSECGNAWFKEAGTIMRLGSELSGTATTVGETACFYSDADLVASVSDWATIQ